MDCGPGEAAEQVNYYNDNDPKAAAWLRELIKQNLIPAGDVDERSIEDVTKSDLKGYTQCHFFAGIGGWSEALRLAGWSADRPVWTGSCPCQPFSSAGKRQGEKDKRHLWPEFYRLIAECNPPVVFGEQVASPLGRKWLAGVRADLEALGYAVGAADLCAASVGAPHIRQRLWWVADCAGTGQLRAHQLAVHRENGGRGGAGANDAIQGSENDGMENPERIGWRRREYGCTSCAEERLFSEAQTSGSSSPCHDPWSDSVWIPCADGKTRRIKPGLEPLVDGLPGRMALLRGAGNAIVPQVAAVFIRAFMDVVSLTG